MKSLSSAVELNQSSPCKKTVFSKVDQQEETENILKWLAINLSHVSKS